MQKGKLGGQRQVHSAERIANDRANISECTVGMRKGSKLARRPRSNEPCNGEYVGHAMGRVMQAS